VYVSSSLLANWDKKGADNEQFVKLFAWDGKQLKEVWKLDFAKLNLGRPHHMKFGAAAPQVAQR
jgi:selenium-binding protein 1